MFTSLPATLYNPVILPQDLTHTKVTSLLDYIYLGEVSLPKTEVHRFLDDAKQSNIVSQARKWKNIVQVSYSNNFDLIKEITDLNLCSATYIGNKKESRVRGAKFKGSTVALPGPSSTLRALPGPSYTSRALAVKSSTPRALTVLRKREFWPL